MREVEGLVFSMMSELGKLKRKVDLLGGAKDTLSHRLGAGSCAEAPYVCMEAADSTRA